MPLSITSTSSSQLNTPLLTSSNNSALIPFVFGLYLSNLTQLLTLLSTQTSNLNGCLQNCSSSGICSLNKGIIGCECFQFFSGSSCQFSTRPCATNYCLNNGTCYDYFNNGTSTFECQCQETFYGRNCQLQIDVCENVTCNDHGYCLTNQTVAKCKCFTSYSGDNCEIESSYVKIVRGIQWTSSIVCFLVIVITIVLIISNDAWNYFMGNKEKVLDKKKPQSVPQRFKYHTQGM